MDDEIAVRMNDALVVAFLCSEQANFVDGGAVTGMLSAFEIPDNTPVRRGLTPVRVGARGGVRTHAIISERGA